MIRRDRELLARMATVNTNLSEVLLHMLDRQGSDELNPDDLRNVGEAFRQLGVDMVSRADEIERTIDRPPTLGLPPECS